MVRAQRGDDHRRGRGRIAKLAGLAVLVLPLTTACGIEDVIRFGWPSGITPQAESMRTLWTWSAIAALVVGAITWGAMFWAVVFHRKRKGSDDTPPRQFQYNLPVEIVFTVVPTIIVAVLFGYTVAVQNYVDKDEPNPDLRVNITASQWNWKFDYPGKPGAGGKPVTTIGDSDTIPLLVLPTEQRIEFTQRSVDVIHSFFVPEFLFKRDVFPMPEVNDQDNVWQIDSIDREGAFVGRCAELCGSYHSMMNFEVRALPLPLFEKWAALRAENNPTTNEPYTAGQALQALQAQGCDPKLCAPDATTTYPFSTDRVKRSATQPVSTGN
ncbi:aa3-type cytochrome oxidase subunit II [Pseudonocardia sp. TRM90224]|uniref:aa3-type cytochrome oxidase subunit II n=1 Tax=Pseudonocardia sp. TRM90224 TaxID=2812678 RepID=UPI003F91D97F